MWRDWLSLQGLRVAIKDPKYKVLHGRFAKSGFDLLDVGCGNHSAGLTKRLFPKVRYSGVDRDVYNNSDEDFKSMERYYRIDLMDGDLREIPDRGFDAVWVNHVIEHIPNGIEVVVALTGKLREKGLIYIEFPSVRSLSLPSWEGTLNFCDDESHVRVYDVKEISNALLMSGCRIVRAGQRQDKILIVCNFVRWIFLKITGRKVPASMLWDFFGFADYVLAVKN
ncbi:class I SAM-dependent methyltransferase [Geobacter grbiciae]|uniref:class I SAM-dependent methyltransferase n=1 Tax=Geobacter grbiciae TaxID=155042 RepID=UPI001C00CE74|nr:methyltransferase domain-containing protein [Geobacter grbiciae]MBT1075042.1 class I SAM-dependent methyltransferase [Geobacter grbiciae]